MASHLMPEILKLSARERGDLAEEIIESLDAELDESFDLEGGEEIDESQAMLAGQHAELGRRIAEYDADPSIAVPIERILAEMEAYK